MTDQAKGMDPRLRRMVRSMQDPNRLAADLQNGTTTLEDKSAAGAPPTPETVAARVLVRLQGDDPPAGTESMNWNRIVEGVYAATVPLASLPELGAHDDVEYIEAGKELAPALVSSIPETRADLLRTGAEGLDGAGVVVGIIDFGCDFTLDDFRNPDGSSRIAFLWDQFLTPTAGEQSPAGFDYGVEYDRAAIDAALGSGDPFTVVRHQPGAASHGTHVAGTAAGSGRTSDGQFPADNFIGAAPGATIVFVQPNARDQSSSFTDSVHVAEAVAYVFAKADELGLPCVINMSLGQNGGSHDGESVVERAIDRLLEKRSRAMVVAAGNEHIWRGHAGGTLGEAETRALRWKAGGELELPGGGTLSPGAGDFTPNEMEIWYSSRDRFRMRLISPGGEASPAVEPGDTVAHTYANGDTAFIDSERFTVLNGDARIYIEVSPSPNSFRVATGIWQVELEAVEVRDGRFDAWIERDARRSINRFADQSFFVGTDFDGIRTLGTPATMRRGIAVANYDHRLQVPNDSSGRGRTRSGFDKPEVAAPGTNILASCSLAGRPNPDNAAQILPARTSMSGTSMAAPHVAGIVAQLLQKNPNLTAAQIRKILIASADPVAGVEPFDRAWGYGRVNAEAAAALVDS